MNTERDNTPPAGDDAQALESFCPPALIGGVRALAPVLYADLKRAAHRERGKLFNPQTMTTTALVHDAFLKLGSQPGFQSHEHFLRVAAVTMRHLLIDRVRAQLAGKRGGDLQRVDMDAIDDAEGFTVQDGESVLAIHNALTALAAFAPRLAEVVECRYFAGYTDAETAKALGVTERTVRRDWVAARAWLTQALGETPPE
jgi:RNA polymerase sigma factor (TIGR02999 family)